MSIVMGLDQHRAQITAERARAPSLSATPPTDSASTPPASVPAAAVPFSLFSLL